MLIDWCLTSILAIFQLYRGIHERLRFLLQEFKYI